VHVAIPALASVQLSGFSIYDLESSPGTHESQHQESVPECVVILESATAVVPELCQAKDLEIHDGEEYEQTRPEQEEIADCPETRTAGSATASLA
jgi:hypothetical protein